MNHESQVSELYSMLFNENIDPDALESLLKIFHDHDDSIDYIENNLRNSDKFKLLTKTLELELEIAEQYYILLNRKPDTDGLYFFRNQIVEQNKSIDWVSENIKNSDEYKKISNATALNNKKPEIIKGKWNLSYKIFPNSVLDTLIKELGSCDEPIVKSVLNIIPNIVPKNGTILDIGANIGGLSLPFAKICVPEGEVFAFEPDSEVREQLLENIMINKLKNIIVNPIAIQNHSEIKSVEFFIRRAVHNDGRTNKGLSTIENISTYVQGKERVKTSTIDKFVQEKKIKRLDVIKCDVEGAEYKVFLGGINTITKHQPVIIYEFSPIIDEIVGTKNSKNCYDFLDKLNYIQYQILPNDKNKRLLKYDNALKASDPDEVSNIICIHKSKISE